MKLKNIYNLIKCKKILQIRKYNKNENVIGFHSSYMLFDVHEIKSVNENTIIIILKGK
jgi:hypothetical protein